MPIERIMPTGEGNPPGGGQATAPNSEALLRQHFGEILNLEDEQQHQIAVAEQFADEQGLAGERRVRYMNAVTRDIANRLFPSQRAYMPLGQQSQQEQAASMLAQMDNEISEASQRGVPAQQLRSYIARRNQLAAQLNLPPIDIEQIEPDRRTPEEKANFNEVSQIMDEARRIVLENPRNKTILESGTDDQKRAVREQWSQALIDVQRERIRQAELADPQALQRYIREVNERAEASGEPMEVIQIISQTGQPLEVKWPETNEGKISRFRNVLNDFEGNFAEEGTATHQRRLQEVLGVIDTFQKSDDPARKALGEKMYEEFNRRYVFHTSYVKYATAADANGVAEGASGPYDIVNNLLLRDLDRGHYANYEVPNLDFPEELRFGETEQRQLADKKDLKVWYSFQWYHRYAKQIREEAVDKQGDWHDRLKKELKDSFHLDDADASSSQLIAQRMWEITFRRSIEDEIVNRANLQGYEVETLPDGTKRLTADGRQKLYEDAEKGGVDFRGNLRGGNALARRTLRLYDYLLTQVRNGRFRPGAMKILEEIDFNSRDTFAHIPGDVEDFLKRELVQVFLNSEIIYPEDGSKKELIGQRSNQNPNVAAELANKEAEALTSAIFGIKKDKAGSWGHRGDSPETPIDFSHLAFSIDDLNKQEKPDDFTDEQWAERRRILERYQYRKDRKVNDQNSAAENAYIQISQHFTDGFFDFRWVRPPAALIPTIFRVQEELRSMMTKADGPLRSPSPQAIEAFGKALDPLNAGKFPRRLQIIRNYIKFEKEGGYWGETGLTNDQTEILINELGLKLEATGDEMAELKRDLVWEEAFGYRRIQRPFDRLKIWAETKAKEAEADGQTTRAEAFRKLEKIADYLIQVAPNFVLGAYEIGRSVSNQHAWRGFWTELFSEIFKEGAKAK